MQRYDQRLEADVIYDDAVCVDETYSKRRRVDGVAGRTRPPASTRNARTSRRCDFDAESAQLFIEFGRAAGSFEP